MAMNFPASPTNGQEFTAPNGRVYVWDTVTWSFKASTGGGGASIAVGDAVPVGPTDNMLWWESDTGGLFLRYNDGNSTQWVQVNGTVADPHSGTAWQIRLNPGTITENVSVPSNYNGMTVGPITIADGVTVDVASGSTWTVI